MIRIKSLPIIFLCQFLFAIIAAQNNYSFIRYSNTEGLNQNNIHMFPENQEFSNFTGSEVPENYQETDSIITPDCVSSMNWSKDDLLRMQEMARMHSAGDIEKDLESVITFKTTEGTRHIRVNQRFTEIFGDQVDISDLNCLLYLWVKDSEFSQVIGRELILAALSLAGEVSDSSTEGIVKMLGEVSDPFVSEAARHTRDRMVGLEPGFPPVFSGTEVSVDTGPLKEPAGDEVDFVLEVSVTGMIRTLSEAQDSVRRLIKSGAKGSITVLVREGVYRVGGEWVFGPEESGHPWLRIIWKAWPGEEVVISGSRVITRWEKVKRSVPGMNPRARGHLWVSSVPDGVHVTTLYKGDSLLSRARSAPLVTVPSADRSNTSLYLEREHLPFLKNPSRAELIWRRTYYMNYLPVQSVDYSSGAIHLSQPATYSFNYNSPGEFWLENAIEFINEPGEWAFVDGKIYYWPEKGEDRLEGDIHYPVAENIIGLHGDIESRNYIQNLTFDGFILKHGKRMSWHEGRVGVQHDWDVFDRGWSGYYLRGAQNCTIQNSTITATGGNGIKLGIHCTRNNIRNNHIHDIGGNGISLLGYGPGKRDETHHNTIHANHIHHIGTLWDAGIGILICQAGNNQITNNRIHDLKYTGIALFGGRSGIFYSRGREDSNDGIGYTRWEEIPEAVEEGMWWHQIGYCHTRDNLIAYNDISRVMLEREDGNGIYFSGNGTGNIVEYNYLHDMDETTNLDAAIRFDDTNWYNTARFNVLVNVKTGFTLKCVNTIENNVIYGYSNRGVRIATTTQVNTKSYGANVLRNIIVSMRPGLAEGLTMVTTHLDRNPTIMEEPTLENNVYHDITSPDAARIQLRSFQDRYGHDMHSMAADPFFQDPGKNDFRLLPGSPARRLGILSIERYGLQEPVGPGVGEY